MSHIVVGTAGHIDHGKSTLVQALTGTDPDRLKEEKERGITIELGFAHTTIGDLTIAFVDVPGHERFVKTMLAGVGGLDCVMLIVAADESVMPQTREHFDICRLLQVKRGLVVLTKADAVDQDTLAIVRLEVSELTKGSFLQDAPVIPVSARTGAGLEVLRDALVEIAATVTDRLEDGITRLPIDRAFSMQGFGTIVTGTLISGQLCGEDELSLVPGDRRARVRTIQVHGRRRDRAVAGQRTAVNLSGIETGEIARGQTLAAAGALTITRRSDAMLNLLSTAKSLKHGARVHFHQGTNEVLARVSIAGVAETEISPGSRAAIRLRFESPVALTRGDHFILRAYSPTVTIGGGVVLDPEPPRLGVRHVASSARFAALAIEGDDRSADLAAIRRMVEDAGSGGVATASLTPRAGIAPARVAAVVRALEEGEHARSTGERLVSPAVLTTLSKRLLTIVSEHHKAQPLVDGVPREEARERLLGDAHPSIFERVISDLVATNKLIVRDRLALPGHRLDLSPEESHGRKAIEEAYRRGGLKPPDGVSLAADAKVAAVIVEKMTALLLRQKVLVRVDTLIFHHDALMTLKAEMQAFKAVTADGRATVDVATFKDRYGVSRKFAIPLLEWLDRERVTRRVGTTRVVL
ncbi:MAG TPA: selenocysteine-specific translation elongation factor [Vicinamibacterales bacterium]|nr:selenocysteine-specific translation elongation factor [Vicinamibacterales bacterium]